MNENPKNALFLKGNKTSEVCAGLLKDLNGMRKPCNKMLSRRNPIYPFDDETSIEFLCQKNDCSLFVMASHTKKRPNNLLLGRTFDGHILDMLELGINDCVTIDDKIASHPGTEFKRLGSKPLVLFLGDRWENEMDYKSSRSMLLDLVKGSEDSGKINLASLDHVVCFTAAQDKILMRTYMLKLKKPTDGSNVPATKLLLSAPCADFSIRRTKWASLDLWRTAVRQPHQLVAKKAKNLSTNAMGDQLGRIHMEKQDWSTMQTRKVKALHANKATPLKLTKEEEAEAKERAQKIHDGVEVEGGRKGAAAKAKAMAAKKSEQKRSTKRPRTA